MEKGARMRIRRDDIVEIVAGKDKGKRGKVIRVVRDDSRIFVEGANMVKKAMKKRKQNDRGGIAEIESSIHASNVMIVCKKCGPTRIGYKLEAGKKVRVCRKCGEAF